MYDITNQEELYHYGVKGMKWGVRRGRSQQAYEKASKKLNKIDRKIQKYENKARKRTMQADKHWYGRDIYKDLADRNTRKAISNMRKAEKWVKQMNKTFAKTPVKLTDKQNAIGQKYADSLLRRRNTFQY